MQSLKKIIHSALKSTSIRPSWWIFSFSQIAILFFVSFTARFQGNYFIKLLISAILLAILQPVVVWLWLDIDADNSKVENQVLVSSFIKKCINCFFLSFIASLILILVRQYQVSWEISALLSSVISATALLGSLYVVICGQTFYKSLALAVDTWYQKFSLVLAAALVLIVAHALGFSFARGILAPLINTGEFSGFIHSATIWLLILPALVLLGFLGAFLNSFLIKLFLNIINRKKEPEAQMDKVNALAASEA